MTSPVAALRRTSLESEGKKILTDLYGSERFFLFLYINEVIVVFFSIK